MSNKIREWLCKQATMWIISQGQRGNNGGTETNSEGTNSVLSRKRVLDVYKAFKVYPTDKELDVLYKKICRALQSDREVKM